MTSYSRSKLAGKYIVAGTTTPDEIEGKAGDIVKKMAADLVA